MTSILPEHTAKTHSTSPDTYRPLGPRVTPDMLADGQRYQASWKDRAPLHYRVITAVRALLSGPREECPAPGPKATDEERMEWARSERRVEELIAAEDDAAAWTCPAVPAEDFEAVSWALADNPSSVPGAQRVEPKRPVFEKQIAGEALAAGWAATEVCPDWCETAHNDDDPQDTHSHCGFSTDVELFRDEGKSLSGHPVTSVGLNLVHHYVDTEPVIQMANCTDRAWVDVTLDEAEALADRLLEMVAAARAGVKAAGEPCEHAWPMVETASAARPGDCRKCGLPFDLRQIGAKVEQKTTEQETVITVVATDHTDLWGGEN